MSGVRLRVGARGSDLSLAQTRWLIGTLERAHPGLSCELIVIETHGDRDQTSALDQLWPPGGFVKEIERALLAGEIDMAVHSLKDVPTEPVPGLVVAAMPERERPNDVLLTRGPATLDSLPAGFVVGSSSPRRAFQFGRRVPGAKIEAIRGNVPTRIRKLMEGQYGGVLLASAGLARLGIEHPHRIELDAAEFPPAPGQGALAAQTRETGRERDIVAAVDHPPTRGAVTAERAFLKGCGGGCHAALGALATVRAGELTLTGQFFVAGEPEPRMYSGTIGGPAAEAEKLGLELARRIMDMVR